MSGDLSPKERRFVAEFIVDQKGGPAAVRAGYSKRSADQIASRLLKRPNIAEAVSKLLGKIEKKSELTVERIQKAVLAVLEFDPRQAFNDDGTLKDISKLPTDVALAIAGIDVDDSIGNVKKLRFSDRIRAAELGAKLLGLLRLEITGKGGAPLIPVPPIDFSGLTREELRRLAGMRTANGNGDSH
jgi:phage terminase small subunit